MTKKLVLVGLVLALVVAGCAAPAAAPTATAVPPTQAPTNTPVPPTATPVPPTNTPVPPTATPVPPTNTPAPTVVTPTEVVAATKAPSEEPKAIPHPVAGIEDQCLTCHGPEGTNPAPESHAAFTVDQCLTCHQVGPEAGATEEPAEDDAEAPKIPHAVAPPQDQCLTCHGAGGIKPAPANHAAFTIDMCQGCHLPED